MEELLGVPGAARKTANVVLGTAYGIASGVVVDTHVMRLSRRLDLTKEMGGVKIERDLIKIIPKEKWILFSHQMIHHGRALCTARSPRCGECLLDSLWWIIWSENKIHFSLGIILIKSRSIFTASDSLV